MFRMGPWEIGLILIIVLIVFGVGKLPQIGGAIGKGIRSFKKAQSGEEVEEEKTETKNIDTQQISNQDTKKQ